MKIDLTQVYGFEAAFRGMRNPLNSHVKSDSFIITNLAQDELAVKCKSGPGGYNENPEGYWLGPEDSALARKLVLAGDEHAKFMRQIMVWADITLPRYLWSEFDTYGFIPKNSESTMHTAHKRFLEAADFEGGISPATLAELNDIIARQNRKEIISTTFIHQFKNALPEGFLQKRTVCFSYATALRIKKQRKNHRLQGWTEVCDWIDTLPYFLQITEK